MPNQTVSTHTPSQDWHVVVERCPESGNFGAKYEGNCLFPSKLEASKFAKAATKADGRRRLVARVVRRYRRSPVQMQRDDYSAA